MLVTVEKLLSIPIQRGIDYSTSIGGLFWRWALSAGE
jgi:hypothetical protein